MRAIKPNPDDPTWTFPYATRKRIENLRRFFLTELKPTWGVPWRTKKTHALPRKIAAQLRARGVKWPSVPRRFVKQTQEFFDRECVKYMREHAGQLPQGVKNSIRMRAANYGRNVLTFKRGGLRMRMAHYAQKKKMWLRYLAWEERERKLALPKTPSKFLDVA